MRTFKEIGPVLVGMGYEPIPVAGKVAVLSDWTNVIINESNVAKWAANGFGGKGVGIRCGTGESAIYAVDIDVLDKDVSELIGEMVAKRFGEAPVRIGLAPKRLMVYTGDPGQEKAVVKLIDPKGVQHKIELLGAGQQFAAYSVHPDTGKPYHWDGMGIDDIDSFLLPAINRADFLAFCAGELADDVAMYGWQVVMPSRDMSRTKGKVDDLDVAVASQPLELKEDEISMYLSALPPASGMEYDQWLKVGMALWHQYQGDKAGLKKWAEWSKEDDVRYNKQAIIDKWKSFGGSLSPVTFASVIHMVKESGGMASKPDKFEALLEEAASVETLEQYDLFAKKVRSIPENVLPAVRRSMVVSELYTGFGAAHKVGKTELRRELSPSKKSRGEIENRDAPAWAKEWVYVQKTCEFHNLTHGYGIKREAFNATFDREVSVVMAEKSASQYALVDCAIPTVLDEVFWPGAEKIFMLEGSRMVNSYRKMGCDVPEGITPDERIAVDKFLKHLDFVIEKGEDQKTFLDWMAYVYQNPGKRIGWAMLLQGSQGTGKSYFATILRLLMGANVRSLDSTAISGRFTAWAHGALVNVVEEIRIAGTNKYEILDKLKPIISNDTIQIEEKGRDHRTVPNFTSYLLLTNHKDAVPLQDGDRRYCSIFGRVQSEEQLFTELGGKEGTRGYFDDLFASTSSGIGGIAKFFNSYKVSKEFNPTGRAPDTSARIEMQELSVSPEYERVESWIDQHQCDVINEFMVDITHLTKLVEGNGDKPVHGRAMGSILLDMGYSRVPGRRINVHGDGYHYVWLKGVTSHYAIETMKLFFNTDDSTKVF